MLLLVGFLLHVCATARHRRSAQVSLSPRQGVSRERRSLFLKRVLKVWKNWLEVALAAIKPPDTRNALAGRGASKQTSNLHQRWLLPSKGNDPHKEMCSFSVTNRAKSMVNGLKDILTNSGVKCFFWACVPQLKRNSGGVLSMPLLNFERLVLFECYLKRREFHFSSMSKYELFDTINKWRMYLYMKTAQRGASDNTINIGCTALHQYSSKGESSSKDCSAFSAKAVKANIHLHWLPSHPSLGVWTKWMELEDFMGAAASLLLISKTYLVCVMGNDSGRWWGYWMTNLVTQV